MSDQSNQDLNISNSVLEGVQIGGIAGRDLTLTQIQGSVASINVFGTLQVPQAPLSEGRQLSRQEYEWRRTLLSKVKQFWIDGVLKKSLHNRVLIELGLEERNDCVQTPLNGIGEFPSESPQVLPPGTSATDIFEGIGAGRTLLILGEPGSGKTVTLLKLADSLVGRAENDISQPLPIVVNLSSWTKQRKPIAEWLVQELYEIYGVSKSLGKVWIEDEQLILLLDGLDEVNANYRDDCVNALNLFIKDHGRTEIVICSRIKDYKALSEYLRLRSAIYVQPLTSEQVEQYLEEAGEQVKALKTILQTNSEIRDFASSPLILSIMSLAYQDFSLGDFPQDFSRKDFRRRLFDTYVTRMLNRRGATEKYTKEKTNRWLIWMAQRMLQYSQTVFLIERAQPKWLQTRPRRILYRLESSLIYGLTTFPLFVFIYGLTYWFSSGQHDLVTAAFIFSPSLIGGLISGLLGDIKTLETIKWSWQEVKKGYKLGITAIIFLAISFFLFAFFYPIVFLEFINFNPEMTLLLFFIACFSHLCVDSVDQKSKTKAVQIKAF
ncbi:MAG: NACHT domain-containing protein [Cyanobacteria bacterium P01_F01_bin.150]